MFTSSLYANEPIISDDTSLDDPLINFGPVGTEPRDYDKNPYCYSAATVPLPYVIPESEWRERIEEMERKKNRLSDLIIQAGIPSKDQKRTNYCWMYGPVGAVETVRAANGLIDPYVPLSAASAAALVKGFRNVGGWGSEALDWLVEYGVCSEKYWPNATISRTYNTQEARENALLHKVTEWYDLKARNVNELMTCLLNRIPVAVGFNWWRHEVYAVDPVYLSSGRYAIRCRNSWGASYGDNGFFVLSGSKMIPDDAVAPRVTVLSNE